jgi:hypothetical protein
MCRIVNPSGGVPSGTRRVRFLARSIATNNFPKTKAQESEYMTNELLQALNNFYESKTALELLVEQTFFGSGLVQVKGGTFKVLGVVKSRPDYLLVRGNGGGDYQVHVDQCTPIQKPQEQMP